MAEVSCGASAANHAGGSSGEGSVPVNHGRDGAAAAGSAPPPAASAVEAAVSEGEMRARGGCEESLLHGVRAEECEEEVFFVRMAQDMTRERWAAWAKADHEAEKGKETRAGSAVRGQMLANAFVKGPARDLGDICGGSVSDGRGIRQGSVGDL